MMLVLALGTQNCDADITTSCPALSKTSPASAAVPRDSLAVTGAVTTGNGGVVRYAHSSANDRRPWAVPSLPSLPNLPSRQWKLAVPVKLPFEALPVTSLLP
jgi:hypothetical protein